MLYFVWFLADYLQKISNHWLQLFARASRFCTRNDGSVKDKGDLDLGANTSKRRKQIFDSLGHWGSRGCWEGKVNESSIFVHVFLWAKHHGYIFNSFNGSATIDKESRSCHLQLLDISRFTSYFKQDNGPIFLKAKIHSNITIYVILENCKNYCW